MAHPWGRLLVTCFVMLFVLTGLALAEVVKPVKPSPKDKCPVCGMFVAKYPDWVGEIIFNDGTVFFFDGAKDLFKYAFNLKKYNPKKDKEHIAAIYVTEYDTVNLINAHDAYYVIGGDVYGPMGRELIPFETKPDAEEFLRDHKGKKIVRFDGVTPEIIDSLD
ncbi:MAG: nitrous oxide reductase accessory protein NosL [Deltaproteobacteria bacterium]|nr:nitrous oxide reductase accessory protein NosL [Deltaproteobacteria bacterium]